MSEKYRYLNLSFLFCSHGRQKFATGAGLWALGAVTGNQGWQNTGAGLAKLGLLSKVGAHVLG